mgnify:CR=1 FL=1
MHIEVFDKQNTVLLEIKDERLDVHNSEDLKVQMHSLLNQGRCNLLVDLSAVRFLDSSGLGTLVAGYKHAEARNGILKLCGLQPQVRSMFELTRLHRIFEIYTSVQEGLDSFKEFANRKAPET